MTAFPSATLPPEQAVIATIKEAGLFNLYCTIHSGMSGKVSTAGSFKLTDLNALKNAKPTPTLDVPEPRPCGLDSTP